MVPQSPLETTLAFTAVLRARLSHPNTKWDGRNRPNRLRDLNLQFLTLIAADSAKLQQLAPGDGTSPCSQGNARTSLRTVFISGSQVLSG